MDKLIDRINEKLCVYKLASFSDIDDKTKQRLMQIETYVIRSKESIYKLLLEIRKLRLNKSTIANASEVEFSRKTIYNVLLLNEYIEKSIEEEEDYLNEKAVNLLKDQLAIMTAQYNKVIENIIDTNILKHELEVGKKEIQNLLDRNEQLYKIIEEKNNTIQNLKKDSRTIRIDTFKTSKKE
jgi:hypothetical protein